MTTAPEVDLTQMYVTEKGLLHTNGSSSELKGRERQFLLLLLCGDSISQRACTGLLRKVDTDSLIARGFLEIKGQSAVGTTDSSLNTSASANTNTSANIITSANTNNSSYNYNAPSVDTTAQLDNETQIPPLYDMIAMDDKNMHSIEVIDPILQLAAGMATLPHSL